MLSPIITTLNRFDHDVPIRAEVIGRLNVGEDTPEYVPEIGDVEVTADVPQLREDGTPLGGYLYTAGDLLTLTLDEEEEIRAVGVAQWQSGRLPQYAEVPQ